MVIPLHNALRGHVAHADLNFWTAQMCLCSAAPVQSGSCIRLEGMRPGQDGVLWRSEMDALNGVPSVQACTAMLAVFPEASHDTAIQKMPMQITTSGAHRCVCVQLRLYNLAVASIERCEALAEMEGSGGIGVDPAAGSAFKVLKQLVHSWLTDAVQNGNRQSSSTASDQLHTCNEAACMASSA